MNKFLEFALSALTIMLLIMIGAMVYEFVKGVIN